MNQYVKAYEKKRRQTIGLYVLVFLGLSTVCLLMLMTLMLFNLNYIFILIPMILGTFFFQKFIIKTNKKNLKTINDLLSNHLDTELVLESYEQLMHKKKSRNFPFIYVGYLKILLMLGEYDKFIEMYKSYPKYTNRIDLRNLKSIVLKLKKDKAEYRECLFKHKFTKYRNVNTKLSDDKEELKFTDQTFELMQLYENKEYREAIEKIDSICCYNNPYNKLLFQSYRERCLYHLGEPCSMPEENLYPFPFVIEWKYLLETGEEYSYEKIDELLEVFEHNEKHVQQRIKKARLFFIAYCIFVAVVLLTITAKEDELFKDVTNEKSYIIDLKVWDYEIQEIYGFCTNSDLAGAVIYGNKTPSEEGQVPGYCVTRIDYYKDGFMPMMKLKSLPLLYLGGTQIYWMEGDSSTYVLVLSDVQGEIVYNGKVVNHVICEKLPEAPLFLEPYAYSFIIDGTYEKGMLTVREELD